MPRCRDRGTTPTERRAHSRGPRTSALELVWSLPADSKLSRHAPNLTVPVWLPRFRFHEGKVEEFKRLSAQCMEIVRTKEPGTLQYEIYFNDDESECIVLERYRDSDAFIEHGANVDDRMETILATASVSGELLGEPSAALRAKMVDAPVRLLTLYQSL